MQVEPGALQGAQENSYPGLSSTVLTSRRCLHPVTGHSSGVNQVCRGKLDTTNVPHSTRAPWPWDMAQMHYMRPGPSISLEKRKVEQPQPPSRPTRYLSAIPAPMNISLLSTKQVCCAAGASGCTQEEQGGICYGSAGITPLCSSA